MLAIGRIASYVVWGALVVGSNSCWLQADEPSSPPEKPPALLAVDDWDYAKARHLLSQAGFSGPPEDVRRLHAMGLEQAVRHLVEFHSLEDVAFEAPTAPPRPPRPAELAQADAQKRQQLQRQLRQQQRAHMEAVRAWWVRRMLETRRPLEEKMVLFWHGHFTSGARTVRDSQAMFDQNQLLRRHAAGNFGQLLHAIVHDPAMLRYLDNNRNSQAHPNENLARELLELFSLGEGNYTERDVQEGARALTGYHVDRGSGQFRFANRVHDSESKTIFGQTGNFDGDQLVDLILEQPSTARWLAGKLFVFFVHDSPDEATIDYLAAVLREHDYELRPLLETMFRLEEFYGPRSMGGQIKSPVQLTIGTLRTLEVGDVDGRAVAAAMRSMGQDLFEPPNVKGWDSGSAWINSNWLLARHRFTAGLVAARPAAPGEAPAARRKPRKVDAAGADRPAATFAAVEWCQSQGVFTSRTIVDRLALALFAKPPTTAERAELVKTLGSLPPKSEWKQMHDDIEARLANVLRLMMTMPAYQLT